MNVNHETFKGLFGQLTKAISHAPQRSTVIKNSNSTELALPGHTIKNEDQEDHGLLIMCIEHEGDTKTISFRFMGKKKLREVTIEANESEQEAHIVSPSDKVDEAEKLFQENCDAVLTHLTK